jgi:hypothetical protein
MSAIPANPYAPPTAPPEPVQIDFRQAAVEESLRILEANPGRVPEDLGVSLVLSMGSKGLNHLRYIGRMTLVRLGLGILGLAAVAGLAGVNDWIQLNWGLPEAAVLSAAAVCSLGGIGLMLANALLNRWHVQRALGPRYAAAVATSTLRSPLCTGVEDSRTFVTPKIAPEEFAYVAFDSAHRRLILEGLIFRYVIHAADVLSVGQQAGTATTGVQIVFRVAQVVVGITLQYDSVWHELRKQTIGLGRDPLLKPVAEALGQSPT